MISRIGNILPIKKKTNLKFKKKNLIMPDAGAKIQIILILQINNVLLIKWIIALKANFFDSDIFITLGQSN